MSRPASACQSATPLREPTVGPAIAWRSRSRSSGSSPMILRRHAANAVQHVVSAVGLAEAARAVGAFQLDDNAFRGAAHIQGTDIELPHRHLHAVQGDAGDPSGCRREDRKIDLHIAFRLDPTTTGWVAARRARCNPRRVERGIPAVIVRNQRKLNACHIRRDRPHACRLRTSGEYRIHQQDLHATIAHDARQIALRIAIHRHCERWRSLCEGRTCLVQIDTRISDVAKPEAAPLFAQGFQRGRVKLPVQPQRKLADWSQRRCRGVHADHQCSDVALAAGQYGTANTCRHISGVERYRDRRDNPPPERATQHCGQRRVAHHYGSIRAVAEPLATSLPSWLVVVSVRSTKCLPPSSRTAVTVAFASRSSPGHT